MGIVSIVIGNICSLLAMGTDALSASRKDAKGMLRVQNISQLLYGIGAIVLQGYSGAVQNAVCIIRNLAVIKGVENRFVKWLLLALGVIFGLYFNNLGLMGLLPVIANLQYTLAVIFFQKNERVVRISFMISAVMFTFFSLAISNYVGIFSNLFVAATTLGYVIKNK